MKVIRTLLFATFFCIGAAITAQVQMSVTDNQASVVIDANTSRMDLVDIRTAFEQKGYEFRYAPSFDNERRLLTIDVEVAANNGAIKGEGKHLTLQNPGASLSIVINKTSGTVNVDMRE